MVFSCYSHHFWLCQNFEHNYWSILCLQMAESWALGFGNPSNQGCRVHQDVDGHHDSLIDCPVLLLLAHSPCSCSPHPSCCALAIGLTLGIL